MVTVLDTPGVYYQRRDAASPTVSPVRTDVAAFVGLARMGPLHTPVPVESARQFEAHFGAPMDSGHLAYSVRAFFENGGTRCWVVRVAGADAAAASTVLRDSGGRDLWRLSASSPGVWGDALTVHIRRTRTHTAVTVPSQSEDTHAVTSSVTGFERAALVELSQPGATTVYRVVSSVDVARQRVYWVAPEPGTGLPYDRHVSGFDRARPVQLSTVEYEFLIYLDGRFIARYDGITLVPEHPGYGPARLLSLDEMLDRAGDDSLPSAPPAIALEALDEPDGAIPLPLAGNPASSLSGGRDGLAYLRVADFIGVRYSPLDDPQVQRAARRGVAALDVVDEIALVAVPGILARPASPTLRESRPEPAQEPCLACPVPPSTAPVPRPRPIGEQPPAFTDADVYQVQAALLQHCENRGDRFALLEAPIGRALADQESVTAVRQWRRLFESRHGALYYPWIEVLDPLGGGATRAIPPSGHVAGQYARGDLSVGVHKAPGNTPLRGATDVTLSVDTAIHGLLNGEGINALRSLPGRGVRVLGVRTLSSDPDWRYINVCRLLMMIQKALELSMQWAVFEPNDARTRTKVRAVLDGYLGALWRRGALVGSTREEAYFIKCDAQNNPRVQRDQGWLIADVGVAPAIPFEFVLLRIGREGNQLHVTRTGRGDGGW